MLPIDDAKIMGDQLGAPSLEHFEKIGRAVYCGVPNFHELFAYVLGTKVSGLRKGLHDGSWSKCLTPTPQPRFLLLPPTPMQLHPFRTNG